MTEREETLTRLKVNYNVDISVPGDMKIVFGLSGQDPQKPRDEDHEERSHKGYQNQGPVQHDSHADLYLVLPGSTLLVMSKI